MHQCLCSIISENYQVPSDIGKIVKLFTSIRNGILGVFITPLFFLHMLGGQHCVLKIDYFQNFPNVNMKCCQLL